MCALHGDTFLALRLSYEATRYEVLRYVHSSPAFRTPEMSQDISLNEYTFCLCPSCVAPIEQ